MRAENRFRLEENSSAALNAFLSDSRDWVAISSGLVIGLIVELGECTNGSTNVNGLGLLDPISAEKDGSLYVVGEIGGDIGEVCFRRKICKSASTWECVRGTSEEGFSVLYLIPLRPFNAEAPMFDTC